MGVACDYRHMPATAEEMVGKPLMTVGLVHNVVLVVFLFPCRVFLKHFPRVLEAQGGADKKLRVLVTLCGAVQEMIW